MRTEAMIEAINSALRKEGICKECVFECKGGSHCMLIAIGSRLRVLQKNVQKAQRLMREAVEDLKDADMLECTHCRHYRAMDVRECEKSDCDCGKCKQECACKYCTNNQRWEWRGFYHEK